ncbi:MAG: NAD(P)-dependent oxidoreductase [Balneolales bacterium]
MKTIEELDEILSTPSDDLVSDIKDLKGDIMILGAAGKMGPSLAMLAQRAVDQSGTNKKVIGVSRFSNPETRKNLEDKGLETITADLMNEDDLSSLPEVENVIYLVGNKFGTTENAGFTWAVNSYLPGRVASKFSKSNIVVFSSGNIYPFLDIKIGGATESDLPMPIGEYAQSCLGRERVFEHFSKVNNTPTLLYRLNYAVDMRYGVLLEIAQSVKNNQPIDLTTGHVNVIWQGDANEIAVRSLKKCTSPSSVLNVTGPETISIRWLAQQFGELLDNKPEFINEEQPTALLNNASKSHRLFGYPSVTLRQMIEWTAEWVLNDGSTLDKPTHFQQRKGKF